MTRHGRPFVSRQTQSGFSLLEMLVALAILSGVAYVALDTVENDTGQRRYELTRERLEHIRRAIVGDPNLVLNGAPVVSGYVADVGRLPECLEQLISRESTCGGTLAATDFPQPPTLAFPGGFKMGWRGPYVTAAAEKGIVDAWGTPNGTDGNWNWSVDLPTELGGDYIVSSLGRDRRETPTGGETFDKDDTNQITLNASEYLVDLEITAISYSFVNNGTTNRELCLSLIAPDLENAGEVDFHHSTPISVSASGGSETGTLSVTHASPLTPNTNDAPIGVRSILLYEADTTTSATCEPNATTFTQAAILANGSTEILGSIVLAPRIFPTFSVVRTFN